LGWLIIGGVAGPYSGKLGEVSTNDNASFLPADAEATRAQDLAAGFVDRETTPALVVYERAGGLTPADQQRIQADAARFADVPVVVGPLPPPVVSQDRQAAQVIVPIDSGEGEQIRAVVERLRDIAGPDRDGLTVDVAGPAGLLGDLIEVFGAIDGPLLLVTLTVVLVILLVVYRSPVLWIFPLLAAGMSYSLAAVFVYLLADHDIVKLNGQAQGILTVLVFGAATNYALLLIARYREELRREEDRFAAMRSALRRTAEPILASGSTVVLGVLTLLLSEQETNRALAIACATGVILAMLSALFVLPAALLLFGRGLFWPFIPRVGSAAREGRIWGRLGEMVIRRPLPVAALAVLLLAGLALGGLGIRTGLSETE
ncbi:MMPL family transporter, partial [Nocardia sp. NPDC003354]